MHGLLLAFKSSKFEQNPLPCRRARHFCRQPFRGAVCKDWYQAGLTPLPPHPTATTPHLREHRRQSQQTLQKCCYDQDTKQGHPNMVSLRLGFAKGREAGFGLVNRSISAGEQIACVAKNCPPDIGQIGSRAIHAAKTYTSSNTHGSNSKAALPELFAKPA